MTRKDYVKLAAALAKTRPELDDKPYTKTSPNGEK